MIASHRQYVLMNNVSSYQIRINPTSGGGQLIDSLVIYYLSFSDVPPCFRLIDFNFKSTTEASLWYDLILKALITLTFAFNHVYTQYQKLYVNMNELKYPF